MRVLVTGATGFICTPLLHALARRGHEVISVTRQRETAISDAATVVWDLNEGARPADLPRDVDAIVHAAQSRNYRAFPANAAEMFRVNVAGTWSLLDYAATTGVRHFCLLSSGTVYEPYSGPLGEDAAMAPTSFLGATKLAAEAVARPYGELFALSVLRLFFPYGPGQRNRLVPDIIERVRTNTPVQLASDGNGLRLAPTFVDDIAEVISAAVTEGWQGTINVASPNVVNLRQLAETIGEIVGLRPVFGRPDCEALHIAPPLDRLRAHFDMAHFTPLEQGLRRVISHTGPVSA